MIGSHHQDTTWSLSGSSHGVEGPVSLPERTVRLSLGDLPPFLLSSVGIGHRLAANKTMERRSQGNRKDTLIMRMCVRRHQLSVVIIGHNKKEKTLLNHPCSEGVIISMPPESSDRVIAHERARITCREPRISPQHLWAVQKHCLGLGCCLQPTLYCSGQNTSRRSVDHREVSIEDKNASATSNASKEKPTRRPATAK